MSAEQSPRAPARRCCAGAGPNHGADCLGMGDDATGIDAPLCPASMPGYAGSPEQSPSSRPKQRLLPHDNSRPAVAPDDRAPKHSPAEWCDCPNPRPGRPFHCAAVAERSYYCRAYCCTRERGHIPDRHSELHYKLLDEAGVLSPSHASCSCHGGQVRPDPPVSAAQPGVRSDLTPLPPERYPPHGTQQQQ